MLAEGGDGPHGQGPVGGDRRRQGGAPGAGGGGDVTPAVPGAQMRVVDDLLHAVEPGVADRRVVEDLLGLGDGNGGRPGTDGLVQAGAQPDPVVVVGEGGIVGEVVAAEHRAGQPLPFAVVGGAEHEGEAVRRRVGAVGGDGRGAHPVGNLLLTGTHGDVHGVAHPLDHRVEQADRQGGAAAGRRAGVDRGEHGGHRVHAGADVGHGDTRLGPVLLRSGDRTGAGLGLHQQVVGPLVGQRAALAVAGDVDRDDPREAFDELLGGESVAGGRARREVLHHDVGPGEQPLQRLGAARVAEVQRDRLLAPVEPDEVRGQFAEHRVVVVAGEVTAARVLHLDGAGAEVGEGTGGRRGGNSLLQPDHDEIPQREIQRSSWQSSGQSLWRLPQ